MFKKRIPFVILVSVLVFIILVPDVSCRCPFRPRTTEEIIEDKQRELSSEYSALLNEKAAGHGNEKIDKRINKIGDLLFELNMGKLPEELIETPENRNKKDITDKGKGADESAGATGGCGY